MKFPLASKSARRAVLIALSVLALGVTIAACGGSSSSGTTAASGASVSTSNARYEARLNLARCFRAHGINVPDPSANGSLPSGALGVLRNYTQSQIQTATQACRQYLVQAFPQLNLTPAQRAQIQHQLVKFAQCMRSHGINIPDPTFNGNGAFGFKRAFGSVDRNSPAFQSAMQACQSLRPQFGAGGGFRVAGGGGSGA